LRRSISVQAFYDKVVNVCAGPPSSVSQCGVDLGQKILFGGSLELGYVETGLPRKCFTVSLGEIRKEKRGKMLKNKL
jgi:hypothetical protein